MCHSHGVKLGIANIFQRLFFTRGSIGFHYCFYYACMVLSLYSVVFKLYSQMTFYSAHDKFSKLGEVKWFSMNQNGQKCGDEWGMFTISINYMLTHWGRVTHICVGKLTNIGSDNGLSPERRQAFIWTNAGILLIGPLGTNFSEFLIIIHTFSFNKMQLKILSAKWRPFCLVLNVLMPYCLW